VDMDQQEDKQMVAIPFEEYKNLLMIKGYLICICDCGAAPEDMDLGRILAEMTNGSSGK
jgi:hypothetical protein